MINTGKYFALLENLKFQQALANKPQSASSASNSNCDISNNLIILEKYVKEDLLQQLQELCKAYRFPYPSFENTDLTTDFHYCYIVRLQHALHVLISHLNFDSEAKEDLISVAHLRLCIQATQELAYYALRCQLHEDFYKSPIFKEAQGKLLPNPALLQMSVQFFSQILNIQQFHIANAMELVQRDLLAAKVSLENELIIPHLSKADFFRHLLVLKATPQLDVSLAKILHCELMRQLNSAQGFASLVEALQQSPQSNATRQAEVVAGIVAQRGFSQQAQSKMIQQIFDFCSQSLMNLQRMSVGVLALRRLSDLSSMNHLKIQNILYSHWKLLVAPEDLLSGLILMEHEELCKRIRLWEQLFCSSSVACLHSSFLIEYLPLLLQLYDGLSKELPERRQLAQLITRCLDNRERATELPKLLQRLFKWDLTETEPPWLCLHQRVLLLPSSDNQQVIVKVAPANHQLEHDMSRILPELLMSGSHHGLTCNVFLALLNFMIDYLRPESSTGIEFISSETELVNFLHSKYQLKLELLIALNQMVSHQPLRAQLSLNSREFVQLLRRLLQQRLASEQTHQEATDQILLLILNLLQELLSSNEDLQLTEGSKHLQEQLTQLETHTNNSLIQQSVKSLLSVLRNEWRPTFSVNSQAFDTARSFMEEKESHLQVYGIQMLINLLKHRDAVTMSQGHVIIALALTTLKHKESYTFLNCVRLFVALVQVMESEVLDKLSDEYLSEPAEQDYRLVVGEAILKAAQELGPLCYRYKAVLLNCFMQGSRSPLPEFRMSAFANLAQLCRLLAYQVHNFFQELLQLINAELSTLNGYVPAKRAAVLVLAELLNGMENLLDYEEMLLPIYRLLKTIESDESCDAQMRQHAANGLKILNEKCRQLMRSALEEHSLVKDIKIMGIKDKPSKGKHANILELN